MNGKEIKIFDPADGFAPFTDPIELTDSTVAKRRDRWWMYLAGEVSGHEGIQLFSASLLAGAPLASRGWMLTPDGDDPTHVAVLAGHESNKAWDLKGGRHCPAYVRGWDPERGALVERIYYAGGAADLWGALRDRVSGMGRKTVAGSVASCFLGGGGLGTWKRL
jgi:hypothetical protein